MFVTFACACSVLVYLCANAVRMRGDWQCMRAGSDFCLCVYLCICAFVYSRICVCVCTCSAYEGGIGSV